MFNYIKWELVNEVKSKILILSIIAGLFIFAAVIPLDSVDANIITKLLFIAFIIVISASVGLAYLYGGHKIMNSYKNQTFLLESMIPLSPKKILFAKYILAIIYDVAFTILFIVGAEILFDKLDLDLIGELVRFFLDTSIDVKAEIFKAFLFVFGSTIAYTSLISFIFIMLKSLFPNGKLLKVLSYIICYFLLAFFLDALYDTSLNQTVTTIILFIFSFLCYLGSTWFVENKMEVYN